MKLHQKLILALLAAVFLPVIVVSAAIGLETTLRIGELNRHYGTSVNQDDVIDGMTASIIVKVCATEKGELKYVSITDPEKLMDTDYLESVNDRMKQADSFLMVYVDEELIYSGSELAQKQHYENEDLLVNGFARESELGGYFQEFDFQTQSGQVGIVLVFTKMEPFSDVLTRGMTASAIAVLVITIFIAIVISVLVYRSIYRPLIVLQRAANNIADGNLDFTVNCVSKDEIGELCSDFEFMRLKLKENAQQQIDAENQNRELISNITHDLKTPITSVKGYVEGLIDGVADTPEKQQLYLRTIYSKTMDLNRLFDELTYYSKISTNRIPYTFSKVNLSGYFEDCVEELSMDFEASGIGFAYENRCREPVYVIMDPVQLRKVVNNLVGNAVKYMDKEAPQVKLTLYQEDEWVTISMADNGKGIAKADLPYIFDRFYRTDSARTSSKGGSGIGLAICRKIMEDHHGKIWADSMEGIGTTMYFALKKHEEETK